MLWSILTFSALSLVSLVSPVSSVFRVCFSNRSYPGFLLTPRVSSQLESIPGALIRNPRALFLVHGLRLTGLGLFLAVNTVAGLRGRCCIVYHATVLSPPAPHPPSPETSLSNSQSSLVHNHHHSHRTKRMGERRQCRRCSTCMCRRSCS